MKFIFVLSFFIASAVIADSISDDNYEIGSSWLTKEEEIHKYNSLVEEEIIKEEYFYEVSVQRINDAVVLLKDDSFIKLPAHMAISYTSGHFKKVSGKLPYLVRAISTGGEGRIYVGWNKKDRVLSVAHGNMGSSQNPPVFTVPLIVNLESSPVKVVVSHDSVE